jgi:hypothetical protein
MKNMITTLAKNKFVQATFICCAATVSSFTYAKAMTGDEIMAKAEDKYIGKTQISDSTMILVNADGNERVRKMMMYRKNFGPDMKDQKAIYFFSYPEDIKDTSYLSVDWKDDTKDDDSWLFLPSLKKVKRLASADQSDAFLGSDFTYTDIKTSKAGYWDYSILKESEIVDGHDCWVLEGTPRHGIEEKALKETGYDKDNIWVRKDNFVKVKGTFWVNKGKKIKYYEGLDVEEISGIWTTKTNKMTSTKNGKVEHTTFIKLENVRYEQEIDDAFFTPLRMTRGVAK